jgi:hypothetical protein
MKTSAALKWLPLAAVAFFFSSASPLAYAATTTSTIEVLRDNLQSVTVQNNTIEQQPSCNEL